MMKAALALLVGLTSGLQVTPTRPGSVPDMYRQRWADAPVANRVKLADGLVKQVQQETEDASDSACVTVFDKEKAVCGEISFDSTDDGMICVEDTSGPTLKWICQE